MNCMILVHLLHIRKGGFLKVGMMKEFIMNDDERIRKHKLVQENRAKRMSLLRYASAHGYTTIVERKSGDMEEERYEPAHQPHW